MKNHRYSPLSLMAKIFGYTLVIILLGVASCGNAKTETAEESKGVDDEAFYETQPLKSGLYDASYFSIKPVKVTKDNPGREGHFDGRVFFALSPEKSALYVFENGNRTKINYLLNLTKPFEKTDSGYVTTDMKGNNVTVMPDSANCILSFERGEENVNITFSPTPRYTGTAVEIMEKMADQKNRK